jgi:hypothetical protein
MGVFVIMAAFVLALTDATNRSTQLSLSTVDATSQARLALDRIGQDLAALVNRNDVVYPGVGNSSTGGNTGNSGSTNVNLLQFLTQVESASESGWSATANRGVSLVGYQVTPAASNNNRVCLQRGATPLQWTDVGYMGLELSDGYPVAMPTPGSTDYDVVSPGVIAMAVGYQLYPDNTTVPLEPAATTAVAQGQIVYNPPMRTDVGTDCYVDLSHVSAVVVGLVAIDLQTLQLLNASQVTAMAGAFASPTVTNTLPAQTWAPLAANGTYLAKTVTGVPPRALQALRVYQRLYPVTPFGRK